VYLRFIAVRDFRSWASIDLPLDPGATVLVGRNGIGKTNLMEAAGYLATQSSHRVAGDQPLVRRGVQQAVVRGAVVHQGRELLLEIEINPGRANRARLNRSPLTRPRDLLGILRTVLFAPEDLAIVRGDPGERRQFLDQLLIMRAPRLAGVKADYERALKQRNSLLKTAADKPRENIPLTGKLAPELVIVLFEKVFPMLPVVVPVSMKMVPRVTAELAPLIVQFVTRLFEASPIR